MRFRPGRCGTSLLLILICAPTLFAGWEQTITAGARGDFPDASPLQVTYVFGWSELPAATATIRLSKLPEGRLQLDGNAETIGLVRTLWKFDVHHQAIADGATLRPIEMQQVENVRSKTITTHLVFNDQGVARTRSDSKSQKPAKTKRLNFPSLFDLHSALLYLRSQPLKNGNVQRIVVYPATDAYLATVTVIGRENITVNAGSYKAIKLDLQLSKVGKNKKLEPHKKFKRATAWVSDDADRLLLRIEAHVFIGTVFAELESVRFSGKIKESIQGRERGALNAINRGRLDQEAAHDSAGIGEVVR